MSNDDKNSENNRRSLHDPSAVWRTGFITTRSLLEEIVGNNTVALVLEDVTLVDLDIVPLLAQRAMSC